MYIIYVVFKCKFYKIVPIVPVKTAKSTPHNLMSITSEHNLTMVIESCLIRIINMKPQTMIQYHYKTCLIDKLLQFYALKNRLEISKYSLCLRTLLLSNYFLFLYQKILVM